MDGGELRRVNRCREEAAHYGLTVDEAGKHWSLGVAPILGVKFGGTILAGGHLRLPNGRDVPMAMTVDELEDCLGIARA